MNFRSLPLGIRNGRSKIARRIVSSHALTALLLFVLTACGTNAGLEPDTPTSPIPAPVLELAGSDVGGVLEPGFHVVNDELPTSGWELHVGGSGEDIGGQSDSFYYAHWHTSGGFELVARVMAVEHTDPWAKAGLMVRSGLEAGATNATVALTADGRAVFQHRERAADVTHTGGQKDAVQSPQWLKLSYSQGEVTGSYSEDGASWTSLGSLAMDFGDVYHLGFAVTSRVNGAVADATFQGVTLAALPDSAPPESDPGDAPTEPDPIDPPTEPEPEPEPNPGSVPSAIPDVYDAWSGQPLVVDRAAGVLANDSDADGHLLEAALETDALHGTVTLEPDGSFVYASAPTFVGSDEFSYRVTDETGSSSVAVVTLHVSAGDPVPVYLGLHVTDQELALWRERATNGPYRNAGDVSANSPGDWSRIVNQADAFLSDPDWRHWSGNTGSTCYEWGDPAPHNEPGHYMRDAAFVYLVLQDTRYRDAVKGELLSLAREPGLDFGDSSRWCTGSLRDGNPALEIGNWLSQLLVAYDYLGDASFTAAEVAELDAWFIDAAHYFKDEVHDSLRLNFVDRLNDDYRLTQYAQDRNSVPSGTSHYGGWDIYSLAYFYNNRRATSVRFFGLVGIKTGDAELQAHAKRFAREFMAYSVFSDGTQADMERWTSTLPDKGWDYTAAALSSLITLADAFARTGDFDLYQYATTEGYYGTESATAKDLLLAIRNHQSYLLSANPRYGTDDPAKVGDSGYLIDGTHAAAGWYSIADITLLNANTYYRDDNIRSIYTRTHADTDPYPSRPAARGHAPAWNGDWGLYPGLLFMFGQTESEVDPFGAHR